MLIISLFFLKFNIFTYIHKWRTHVLLWGHRYACFGFLVTFRLGFKARVGSALFIFAEVNVMYIPQDPPLVLHMLTSGQLTLQPVTSPHASAEVGLCSDLNGQSPAQKTNVLPLCQRPGYFWSPILLSS